MFEIDDNVPAKRSRAHGSSDNREAVEFWERHRAYWAERENWPKVAECDKALGELKR